MTLIKTQKLKGLPPLAASAAVIVIVDSIFLISPTSPYWINDFCLPSFLRASLLDIPEQEKWQIG